MISQKIIVPANSVAAPKCVVRECKNCHRHFQMPQCWSHRHFSCSSECGKEFQRKKSNELKLLRTRKCKRCGSEFLVKKSQIDCGVGIHCSHLCASADGVRDAAYTPEAREKSVSTWKKSFQEGKFSIASGSSNSRWSGGLKASQERNKHKAPARIKAYRKKNPEKVREWCRSRRSKKIGRLPNGTVLRIRELQKNKCAICRSKLDDGFHIDHIFPLKLGGKHESKNIQILCATCNVRKWATHPVDFMQSRGFLI